MRKFIKSHKEIFLSIGIVLSFLSGIFGATLLKKEQVIGADSLPGSAWTSTSSPYSAITFRTHGENLYLPFSNTTTSKLTITGILFDKDGEAGTAGQVLSSTGSATDWIAISYTAFGTDFYTYFHGTTTDALTQGLTNLYWSNTLFDNRLSASSSIDSITTLSNLSITKSQVSDFGTYLTTIGSGSAGELAYWSGTNTLSGKATSTPTVSAPLAYSGTLGSFVGGVGGAFTCNAASAAQAGCLSAADWVTFNNKWDLSSSTIGNNYLTNSTISGISLGSNLANLTATDGTLTFSGTYNGGTARTIGLNLGNANTWTALQTFGNSSTSRASFDYSSSTKAYNGFLTITGSLTAPASFGGDYLTVSGSALNLDVEVVTRPGGFTISSSSVSTSTPWGGQKFYFPTAATLVKIWCSTDSGTSTIQLEKRTSANPNAAGTDILFAGGLACGAGAGQTASSTFAVTAISADDIIVPEIADAEPTGNRAKKFIDIYFSYTVND